jgi:hypothetical protein
MSTDEPKQAPNVSLPLTFQNSFWTPDYRTGLNVLFAKLEQVRHDCFALIQSSRCAIGHR